MFISGHMLPHQADLFHEGEIQSPFLYIIQKILNYTLKFLERSTAFIVNELKMAIFFRLEEIYSFLISFNCYLSLKMNS